MLELRNIKKHYNNHLVLEIPFIRVESAVYWVKGINGSGKTTFLKMIAGLLPFEGDIIFRDISLKNKPVVYRQNVSWAEAEPLFPSFMRGKSILSLYQQIRRVNQKEVDYLLELFGVADYINDEIGTYSAGMTKKLSLVLAFLGSPPLIVLDEPLITLDQESLNRICAYIFQENKNKGSCFLMSSHHDTDGEASLSKKEIIITNKGIVPNEFSR